ncbi:HD domain-containing protein [Longispora sp. NPDC051575]|uniref:HD domain-containing protein n=1 Tax=Longispora sp. NPDC051575 TaxID=3154943 RepID=UPI003441E3A6
MTDLVSTARALAEAKLADTLPRRWKHVQAVAEKAEQLSDALDETARQVLIAAAWLHDIGYAPDLVETGFHPLDGARWLREQGFDDRVVCLVAHHSCAHVEAEERGLADDLKSEFVREQSPVADELWYCDMTTGPDGQNFDVESRLVEIHSRYGPEHIVTRFIQRARPEIVTTVRRVEDRLRQAGHPM